MNDLEKRVIELTYRNGLTHLSSCLNCVNLLDWIYEQRGKDDPVIMGNAHASLALYVVLEKHGMCDAQEMIDKHGVHCSRDMEHGIWCSGGSLGQPETVAVGFALADPRRTVWLVTSDGACAEGSVHESFRFVYDHVFNLKVWIVFNGYGAYGRINIDELPLLGHKYEVDQNRYPEFLRGLQGHYIKINQAQYEELMA